MNVRNWKVREKLLFPLVGGIVILSMLITTAFLRFTRIDSERNLFLSSQQLLTSLSLAADNEVFLLDAASLNILADELNQIGVTVFFYDAEGRVIGANGDNELSLFSFDPDPLGQAILAESGLFTSSTEDSLIEGTVIKLANDTVGAVSVEISKTGLNNRLASLRNIAVAASALVTILVTGLVILLSRNVTRPIIRLQNTVSQIADGSYDIRAQITTNDEVGQLGQAVNQMVGQIQDRDTRINQHSESLQRINEELQGFTYIVSHDLRSPIASIDGYNQSLVSAWDHIKPKIVPNGTKEQTELYIEDVDDAISAINVARDQMYSLVQSLLKLSREGRRTLSYEDVNTTEVVERVLLTVEPRAKSQQISIDVEGKLPEIFADPLAFEQIVLNLIDNAIKYSKPDTAGTLTIRAEETPTDYVFHVADTGRGIRKQDRDKIFQVFRRGDNLDIQGEGIGLSFVQTLVRRHGGNITFESVEGEGTTFTFTIAKNLNQLILEGAY
jgi:signal transduction histidine kinase